MTRSIVFEACLIVGRLHVCYSMHWNPSKRAMHESKKESGTLETTCITDATQIHTLFLAHSIPAWPQVTNYRARPNEIYRRWPLTVRTGPLAGYPGSNSLLPLEPDTRTRWYSILSFSFLSLSQFKKRRLTEQFFLLKNESINLLLVIWIIINFIKIWKIHDSVKLLL